VYDFAQEDLIADDVMLLDTYTEVFVWIGSGANDTERGQALEIAVAYIKGAPDTRSEADVPIVVVKQGSEPPIFTSHFVGWSHERAKVCAPPPPRTCTFC
jgi:advillin